MEKREEVQRKKRLLQYLCVIGLFAIFSTTISKNPVLPIYAESLGAGSVTIGLISAVSPFAGILLSFPVGVLSDHLGRRRLLILSGFVFLIAQLLYLVAIDPLLLIPVRFFHGMATAILGPVVCAVITEQFGEHKGQMMGTYSSATLVGRSAAPLTGGGGAFSCCCLLLSICVSHRLSHRVCHRHPGLSSDVPLP